MSVSPPLSPPALFLVEPWLRNLVFDGPLHDRLGRAVSFVAPPAGGDELAALDRRVLAQVEVIVSSWGMPQLTPAFLERFPALRMVFFAGGSVRSFVTSESWARGVRVVAAARANAIPVAEYVFAQVVLCLKHAWPQANMIRARRGYRHHVHQPPGAYRSTVGLVALGHVGRLVAERLRSMEVAMIAYDPYFPPEEAARLGVRLCSLEEVFAASDVVSCHLPELPETVGLLTGAHFRAMRVGASFVNTARGSVVREDELTGVLRERPDLFAVLDVTEREPPPSESPLYDLPNVMLTPHLAGSLGGECRRLGRSIVEDVERFVLGNPIANEITQSSMEHTA
jgi:phosphoglycerate dehydrogenase-like enzyme